MPSPERFQKVPKEVGTKKLVLGRWVTVTAEDDDAIPAKKKGPAQSTEAGGKAVEGQGRIGC